MAGMHKHKWIYTLKNLPDHFGKHGFKSLQKKTLTINLGELTSLFDAELREPTSNITIDLDEKGFEKLLGKGIVSIPLQIKVKEASKKAVAKIVAAGGKVITLSESS